MFGAFIGDIVGSKYEFNNIKTKEFPLFSQGCDYTDDSIMTVAVAKAIMMSRTEQSEKNEDGKGFQEYLVSAMQIYGRRYPTPLGAYGGSFANWLRQSAPKPYGSYGNGSAMRVSPCGLAAVTMDEAIALARASASITHNHPEGIRGAEAVSAAVFLAKCGKSKEEIRQYISQHYYNLDFTLDSIRDCYTFDGSCQGSVPQAIVAFLESENFEDAIRNVISIGGDCDTTGAITGSIAWIYYAGYSNWVTDSFDPPMQRIKAEAMKYLPKEFIDIAQAFVGMCARRARTYDQVGSCTAILNRSEQKAYWPARKKPSAAQTDAAPSPIPRETRQRVIEFCEKYIGLMEKLYRDKKLNQWCRNYSDYNRSIMHRKMEKTIYEGFVKEACALDMPKILSWKPYYAYRFESALTGTVDDLIFGIFMEIHADHAGDHSLIRHAIADGRLYHLMHALLSRAAQPQYTLDYIMAREASPKEDGPGALHAMHVQSMKKWYLRIALDSERLWYLRVFVRDDGSFEKFSLDQEAADDSHYEFTEEQPIREKLYMPGDENKYFHEILIRYVQASGGEALLSQIMPYVTAQFHYY